MKNPSFKFLIFSILLILGLSECSHWQGDLAKIVISFGGAGRAVEYNTDEQTLQKLEHKIELSNKRETFNFQSKGMTPFEAFVEPGNWTIWVYSRLNDDVYAAGTEEVNIQSGQDNNILIKMYQAHLVKFDSNGGSSVKEQVVFNNEKVEKPSDPKSDHGSFSGWYADAEFENLFDFNNPITKSITLYAKWDTMNVPGSSLANKLEWLNKNTVDGGNYVVTVASNGESINSGNRLGYNGKKVIITLTGGTVKLKDSGTMFNIDNGVTLVLENVTLKGLDSNNMPLVIVEGNGKLVMNIKSEITENHNNHKNHIGGGGVFVSYKGTFEMNAGDIYKNKTLSDAAGSGVFVWGGTFEMNGGDIKLNNSDTSGGGVFIMKSDEVNLIADGTFIMNGGKITGNTAKWGGGVSVHEGTFNMSGGEISGNKAEGTDKDGWYIGGGVRIEKSTFNMTGGTISDNTAQRRGGGVHVDSNSTFTMGPGIIKGNYITDPSTDSYGGGVRIDEAIFTMNSGEISGNRAESNVGCGGGALDIVNGKFEMKGGTISGNTTKQFGGGILVSTNATFNMTNGTISGNTAGQQGGGVFVNGSGKITKTGGTIYGYTTGDNNSNKVENSISVITNNGHAVLVQNSDNKILYHREITAGPNDSLDSSKNANEGGGWEN